MLRVKYSLLIMMSVITMGHPLTVQRRRSICSSVRHQTSSCRHFGLQIFDTLTHSRLYNMGCPYSSEFTSGKSKLWTSCDSLSLRNGNAWNSACIDNAVKQWRRRLRSCVASKGSHFSQCRTSYRKRYAV